MTPTIKYLQVSFGNEMAYRLASIIDEGSHQEIREILI